MAHIERNPIKSTSLKSVGYDPASHVLAVEFAGGIYHHHGVAEDVAQALQSAGSAGQFYNQHIRGKYQAEKVPA